MKLLLAMLVVTLSLFGECFEKDNKLFLNIGASKSDNNDESKTKYYLETKQNIKLENLSVLPNATLKYEKDNETEKVKEYYNYSLYAETNDKPFYAKYSYLRDTSNLIANKNKYGTGIVGKYSTDTTCFNYRAGGQYVTVDYIKQKTAKSNYSNYKLGVTAGYKFKENTVLSMVVDYDQDVLASDTYFIDTVIKLDLGITKHIAYFIKHTIDYTNVVADASLQKTEITAITGISIRF